MRRSFLVVVLLFMSSLASAQEWRRDRRYTEGAGVAVGSNLVLHPGLGLEVGYDSNIFYTSSSESDEVLGAGRLRVTPHLDLSTRSPQRLENGGGEIAMPNTSFRLGVAASYHEYFSDEEIVTSQRNVGVDGVLRAEFLRRRPVSFFIGDTFLRTTEPGNELAFATYNRVDNRTDFGLKFAPGGRTLEFTAAYGFLIRFYEEETIQAAGNVLSHDLYLTSRWRFFPKTALLVDGHVTPTTYYADGATHPSSFPVRTRAGMNGLLTQRLGVLAMVGYGAGFYSSGDDFDSVVGQVELSFLVSPVTKVKLGYSRDFYDSIFSNYYLADRGYLEYNQMISGRVLLGITAGIANHMYATLFDTGPGEPSTADRRDLRADVSLNGEYRARDWLGFNLSLQYLGNFTNFTYTTAGATDYADFSRLVAFGGVRLFY